jgi:hypothetical protein
MARLLVVGTGSLARATCAALSTMDGVDEVTVLGRVWRRSVEVCAVATLASAAAGRRVSFTPVVAALDRHDELAGVLASARPDVLLVVASSQSPWERLTAPSPWTRLVQRAGFGLTLAFQAEIALAVSRAATAACPGVPVLNGCFPDAVNPLLAQAGAGVLAGVGNVALLATAAQAALGRTDPAGLALLGHHLHLHEPPDPAQEAVLLVDGEPRADVAALLAGVRAADRPGLNTVTGAIAARLLVDLATGASRDTHLPGVAGLPGGWPVRVHGGDVQLRLPAQWPLARALPVQQAWSRLDGVLVADHRVEFGPAARAALAPLLPELAAGFAVADLAEVTGELGRLRDRLRAGEDKG